MYAQPTAGAAAAQDGSGASQGAIRFSIIVPVHDEQDNVLPLLAEIAALGEPPAEIVFVDDGSTDGTAQRLRVGLHDHRGLRLLRHARRAGQSAAIHAGVRAARSPWIVTMDGDGQNDPRDVALLVAAARADGRDDLALVAGLRRIRRDSWQRRAASRIANTVRNAALMDDCPDTGCSLKLFRREAFLALPFFSGMHRFLPALFQTSGLRVAYVPVSHRPRRNGRTKYTNLKRALPGLVDLLGVLWLRRRMPRAVVVEEVARPE